MLVGLAYALGSSSCYGIGSVLQSAAATDVERVGRLDPRLLVTLVRTWRYPAGLALDAVGFVLSVAALRSLPLYVVQAVISSFLAVTAVAGVLLLGIRLRRIEVVALVVVVLGLALVGLSAASRPARDRGSVGGWLLLAVATTLAVASVPLARVSGRRGSWVLGALAGLAFGVVAVAARGLTAEATRGDLLALMRTLASTPASYALLLAAPLAMVTYAIALQRGTVIQATAPLVVGETVLPALAGLVLLGDRPRPGWEPAAALGFVLAVGASLLLSRFGEVEAAARTEL